MYFRILSLFVMTGMSVTAYAAMNKWVDEKGQVHYGDEVPAEYLHKQREILNEQGVVVKDFKSQEQLEKERQEQAAANATRNAKLIESKKQDLRDRVLLETFTTERDFEIARSDRVSAVDSQIQLTESNIKDGERKMKELNERIAAIEKSGRKVPDNVYKEKDSVSRQLESNYKYVETKQDERKEINRKIDEDVKRFRELKGIPEPEQKPAPAQTPLLTPVPAPAQ
jgi:hypothetical protein